MIERIPYTGIGSRETPSRIILIMQQLGEIFAKKGLTLRSGAARGADWAFEQGCIQGQGSKEIFLPWDNFKPDPNNQPTWVRRHNPEAGVLVMKDSVDATLLASRYHPTWETLGDGARKLMARNTYQILGPNLDYPTKFVVYWAPMVRGKVQGGTGQAIRMATHLNIPTFHLGLPGEMDRLATFYKELRAV